MKKPEKKELGIQIRCCTGEKIGHRENDIIESYNHAIDDYEAFLPSEEEIYKIINKTTLENKGCAIKDVVAKAISKRLRGE